MRHGFVVCAFVLLAGLLLGGDSKAGNLEPPGPPSPTMKTLSQVEARIPITTMPVTIAAPGSYYLTGDLFGVAGQVGINISSSFVTLDLNGFSLIGVPSSLDGIRASFAGTRQIVIRNGVIRSWGGAGISAFIATDVTVEDLRVDGNGAQGVIVGARSIVRNTTSRGNVSSGIFVDSGSTIIGCTAGNNGSTGFELNPGSLATDCTAQQNQTGFGLSSGSRVVHSVARENSTGILGGDGASIVDCTAEANTDDGIRVGSRGLVRGNVTRSNTNDGIEATANENRIEENESSQNGSGIAVFGTSNLVVKNSVSANLSFEYLIFGAGNKVGTISTDPTTAGPWANFDL